MGFRTYTCVICGEQVTKPRSYAYGEGRACRSHEEVQKDQIEKFQGQLKAVYAKLAEGFKGTSPEDLNEVLKHITASLKHMLDEIHDRREYKPILSLLKQAKMIGHDYSVSSDLINQVSEAIKNLPKESPKKDAPKKGKENHHANPKQQAD